MPVAEIGRYGTPRQEPLQVGDLILFHNLVLHASGENSTADQVRWSIDLRYMATGQSFKWHTLGDDFDLHYPGFVARSDEVERVMSWAAWRARWERP